MRIQKNMDIKYVIKQIAVLTSIVVLFLGCDISNDCNDNNPWSWTTCNGAKVTIRAHGGKDAQQFPNVRTNVDTLQGAIYDGCGIYSQKQITGFRDAFRTNSIMFEFILTNPVGDNEQLVTEAVRITNRIKNTEDNGYEIVCPKKWKEVRNHLRGARQGFQLCVHDERYLRGVRRPRN